MARTEESLLRRAVSMYVDGFRSMTVGRTLWLVILIKLFVMFAVLKLFFFRDPMAGMTAGERADTVIENLTGGAAEPEP